MNRKKLKKYIAGFLRIAKKKNIIPITKVSFPEQLLDEKVVLVTGGSGGIGIEIAKACLSSGGKVIIAGTNLEKLAKIKTELNTDKIAILKFDYTKPELFSDYIDEALSFWKRIDIFVSSVGIHSENFKFLNMTICEYDRVMKINLKGTYFACQTISNYMIANHIHGHILLISSTRGSEPAWSPYGLSKWGIEGLIKGLAKELIPYGIVVNGLAPGSTATSLLNISKGDSIYADDNHIGRMAMPEEIANFAIYLISNAGNMVVGETLHIGGGRGIWDIR